MFDVGLDLLYFQPQEDNIAYVVKGSSIENPDMKWGWGFRLDLGNSFKRDDWRVDLIWTCLPVQNDTEAEGHLRPIWSNAPQTPASFVDKAKVHWRLHLGIVDLLLAKPWDVSPRLTLSPNLGVRYASLRQKFFVSYFGGNLFVGEEDTFHSKNKYEGVGPVIGCNADFSLCDSLSVIGSLGYATVWGETYVHEKEWEKGAHITHFRLFDIFPMSASLVNLALGLEWAYNQCHLHVKWEQYYFPNQNHLQTAVSSAVGPLLQHTGDLSVAGVSGGVRWSF